MPPADRLHVYREYFLKLDPVLQEMTRNGVMLDAAAVEATSATIEQQLAAAVAPEVPKEVLAYQDYAKAPAAAAGEQWEIVLVPGMVKRCSICGQEATSKTTHQKGKANPCKKGTLLPEEGSVPKWRVYEAFNPMSAPAVGRYAAHFKHKGRHNHKTGKVSFDDTAIEALERRYGAAHPIYRWILDQRKLLKAKQAFFDPLQGRSWVTGSFTHNPESGRLSMQNLNFQQWSKSGEVAFAKELRNCVVARPGYTFVGADSSSIEAVMVAWFADDPTYMDITLKGVHAYLACAALGLEFTPHNIEVVKSSHKALYNRKKRTVHGSAYCMTPPMLAMSYPLSFPTVADAKAEQDAYFTLCPAVPAWWDRTRDLASMQGWLENPWGFRNYFWKVFQKDHKGVVTLGPDGKSVISFLPQSSAAFWMRRCLLEIARRKHPTWYIPAIGAIHDGYILEVPLADAQDAENLLLSILTDPIPQMSNLRIGAEADRGERWGSMYTTRSIAGSYQR